MDAAYEDGKRNTYTPEMQEADRVAAYHSTLRAVYDRAYFAGLGTFGEYSAWEGLVADCHAVALETVRQWPAMQAELDALIGEMK